MLMWIVCPVEKGERFQTLDVLFAAGGAADFQLGLERKVGFAPVAMREVFSSQPMDSPCFRWFE